MQDMNVSLEPSGCLTQVFYSYFQQSTYNFQEISYSVRYRNQEP